MRKARNPKSDLPADLPAGRQELPAQAGIRKSTPAEREEEILQFWKENKIFEKTLEKPGRRLPAGRQEFVFYEGPPTANGRPGIHHLESRAFKDVIPRFKTMQGYHVRRKAGWDTHGLPVELEVEKKLGLKSKKDIEEYGIDKFNEKCKESVWTYVDEWEKFSERMAFWLDFERPYVTYKPEYIESVWQIFKKIHERGLLYKDYKVVPWCPRCGTALSSHELAQGHEDIEDVSVYVKFKAVGADEYFLAWTTTPWTLLGNVALAVGEGIEYVLADIDGEKSWLAKDRLMHVAPHAKILEEVKGKSLVGRKYKPLFPFLSESLPADQKNRLTKAFQIYDAPFVTTEEGTGIVHTAVMYGQDDFELGTKVDLPKFHLVDEEGKFTKNAGSFSGRSVIDEKTNAEVIEDLKKRKLLFSEEKHTHTYPFCWRCETKLIYYARDSWYIKMSALRQELIEENKKINWQPEHIKEGRFGEWLSEVKDWAISRERYWGTPLPIWLSDDGSEMEIIGSVAELKEKILPRNTYYVIRHGESLKNINGTVNSTNVIPSPLTEHGKEEAKSAIKNLLNKGIELIITSPLTRAKETAEIIAGGLNLKSGAIIEDERLIDIHFGSYEERPIDEYRALFASPAERFTKAPEGGENWQDLRRRMGEFIYDLDRKIEGKIILLVTHELPVRLLDAVVNGLDSSAVIAKAKAGKDIIALGEILTFQFMPLPHGDSYEIDLHRPYIDEITYLSKKGKLMRRVPEVMDAWFDSGAMPFAQDHYPFENKEWVDGPGYPADYISEAIDQTRGWFYTLHAVGVLMERGRAFKSVICLGLILDTEGQKMSKSKGNVVDPWEMMGRFGADPLRFWMYSVNQPGESKNFDEKTVDEVVKKVFNLLLNCVKFYELYADRSAKTVGENHILDRWIHSLLNRLVDDVTASLESYKVFEAARSIREFIADLSQWYVRRSRDRLKSDKAEERTEASGTLREVLLSLAELMAPFTPFLAEDIQRRLGGERESVHLRDWPTAGTVDGQLLESMRETRRIVSLALEARDKAGIKNRQPLRLLELKSSGLRLDRPFLDLIGDEVNVKEVVYSNLVDEVRLDTALDEKLREEGKIRELIRSIQDLRKDKGLTPRDNAKLSISTTAGGQALIEKWKEKIASACKLSDITFGKTLPPESDTWFRLSL
ncbi:isoleucine--tRNA ligase [Patescibacteria group bacterium]|nr:MAG: isoleucine--tRNA ligase [Patescibacteria group bacterium]